MKKCLKYMSEYWHWEYYIALVSGFVFLPIPRGNIFMVMALTYVINAMSLSMFGMDSGIIYRKDGRDKLTLSLPMSRKTIYDTRMYVMSSLYLACVLLSLIAYIPKGMYGSYLCTFSSLLFGHMMCGLCIRKPHCHSLSGIPAFIVSWLYIWENINENVETSMLLKVVMGNICVVMLAIDVYVWLHERRIFINGSSKGNVVRKGRADEKHNGTINKKIKKETVITLIIIGGLISVTMSKDFMLRSAVFFVSPKSALTMEYEYYKDLPDSDNAKLYVITKNIPVEKATQGELYTWVVYNYGPFYFAAYYGEG